MRRGPAMAAGPGGLALIAALWLTWFSRLLSSVFTPVRAVRAVSGWGALGGGLGAILVGVAVVAVAWSIRCGRPSGVWVVVPGALALIIEVGLAVGRIGADGRITTVPAAGLVVALLASIAIVLAGLVALLARPVERT